MSIVYPVASFANISVAGSRSLSLSQGMMIFVHLHVKWPLIPIWERQICNKYPCKSLEHLRVHKCQPPLTKIGLVSNVLLISFACVSLSISFVDYQRVYLYRTKQCRGHNQQFFWFFFYFFPLFQFLFCSNCISYKSNLSTNNGNLRVWPIDSSPHSLKSNYISKPVHVH